MKIRGYHTLIIAIIILLCSSGVSFAAEDLGYTVTTMVFTQDVEATYIEGSVDKSVGQELTLKEGFKTIASKTLPNNGRQAYFKIKVPAANIDKNKVNIYRLRSNGGQGDKRWNARVEIQYQERESQEISVSKRSCALTLPGMEEKIQAKATSGGEIIFISENPKVATVDRDGTVTPVGQGETKISVQQVGDGRYKKVEKKVNVSVEEIDAYMVTFHSSDDKNNEITQMIRMDEPQYLQENTFENGSHRFLGWATEDGGIVRYTDAQQVADIGEKGETVDLYAVWTGDGAAAALAWAIEIANDDSFAYGTGAACHRIGCYFCGTNQKNKPLGYEKTYVCLTFIGAAYAHGAEDPEILWADQNNKMPMYENEDNFRKFSCWTKLGSCGSLSINDLKPGDVIIEYAAGNDTGHVCMYVGGDDIVESAYEGWGANTIRVTSGASKYLRRLSGNSRNYVMRYTGANAN